MKKKLSIVILLISSLCLLSCNNTVSNNAANRNNNSSTASESDRYIIENSIITDPDEALDKLKEGNKRFFKNESELINVTSDRRDQLEDEQNPYAVIVSCSDSRVTPTTIFNCGLGEIFDIRLAGNVVDDLALGSIEYGVEHLHSPLIIIMGHEKCGAVTAAYNKLKQGTEVKGNINSIVDKILPEIHSSVDLKNAIQENVDAVYDQVKEDDIVKSLVDAGKVKIVKAYYTLDGKVNFDW